jgi:hypothetical protein
MALLFENARAQGLSTDSASTVDPYVLEVLSTSKSFLAHLGQQFDKAHKKVHGCVVSDSKHMDIKQKIKLFCKWSSTYGQ